jgi:hypothetical protein
MREMADSVTPGNLPPGLPLYAGYDDGHYMDVAQIRALERDATAMAVTTDPADNEGDCLDVENGDARPEDAPPWTDRRRVAGHPGPLNYCSEDTRQALLAAYASYQNGAVPVPGLWVAAYPGKGPVLQEPTDVGHQFVDHGGWDQSVMVDYLPGIDPAPPLPPLPAPTSSPRGDDMLHTVPVRTDISGNGWVETTIPWADFMAVALEGSDPQTPEQGGDGVYWPGTVKVQDRNNMVLVTVTGFLPSVVANVFVCATA